MEGRWDTEIHGYLRLEVWKGRFGIEETRENVFNVLINAESRVILVWVPQKQILRGDPHAS